MHVWICAVIAAGLAVYVVTASANVFVQREAEPAELMPALSARHMITAAAKCQYGVANMIENWERRTRSSQSSCRTLFRDTPWSFVGRTPLKPHFRLASPRLETACRLHKKFLRATGTCSPDRTFAGSGSNGKYCLLGEFGQSHNKGLDSTETRVEQPLRRHVRFG